MITNYIIIVILKYIITTPNHFRPRIYILKGSIFKIQYSCEKNIYQVSQNYNEKWKKNWEMI